MEADDTSVAGLPQLLGRFRRLVLKDKHTSHSEPTAAAASDTDCGRPQSDPSLNSGDIEQEQQAEDSCDTQEETVVARMRQQNIRVERGNKVGTISNTELFDVWIHSLKISKKNFSSPLPTSMFNEFYKTSENKIIVFEETSTIFLMVR